MTMALVRGGHDAELSIANTGPGIRSEEHSRIFDRFYRGLAARNLAIEGCGLGLSIVRWIVVAHGGHIHLESEPGRWTIVSVTLPLVPALASPGGRPLPSPGKSSAA